jgi:hypothetical protein
MSLEKSGDRVAVDIELRSQVVDGGTGAVAGSQLLDLLFAELGWSSTDTVWVGDLGRGGAIGIAPVALHLRHRRYSLPQLRVCGVTLQKLHHSEFQELLPT